MDEVCKRYNLNNTLIISLETNLSCNLSCPYCYQKGTHDNRAVFKSDLDFLVEYCEKVYKKEKYRTLVLKVLGGEPALRWELTEYVLDKLCSFCRGYGICFKLMIDTNGTLVDKYLKLTHLPNILFTIPLTYSKCHNTHRKYHSGVGSYDDILENVNRLKSALPKSDIVLRYNMDGNNIGYFKEFIWDLKSKLEFKPIISPNYTLELGQGNYKNSLTHDDFINWCSTDFIDIMVEAGYPIIIAPATLATKCQYWQRYSLKMFSDGTAGACAMSFFNDKRPHIKDVIENIDDIGRYWNGAKGYDLTRDTTCRDCDNLFLCCGAYKIPCISSLGLEQCKPQENVNVNLKLFLRQYLKYVEKGYEDLFVGFNNYEIYK